MVTGDALGLMPAYIRALGVSTMAAVSGVKQYWRQPRGVRHHDPDFSGYLQGLHDEVDAFIGEVILKDTTYSFILVEEFWYRENGEEHECTMRRFHSEIHDDVSKADKKGIGDAISGHCRNIGFV